MPKVGVFISWSENSHELASALHEWLPTALHSIKPWMSNYDIHKGTRFLEEIDRALKYCKAGIICITPENSRSVWVAFEAGALASRIETSKLVVPLLSRMRPAQVTGPLSMFQACQLTRSDMLHLMKNLNDLNSEEDVIPETRLEATFDGVWPTFEAKLPELEKKQVSYSEASPAKKTDTELIEEVLDVSKSIRILVEERLRTVGPLEDGQETVPLDSVAQPPMSSGAGLEGRESFGALAHSIGSANEIWLAGISLVAVIRDYYATFAEAIRHERIILRFLLLDPDDNLLLETATRSLYGVSRAQDLTQDISAIVKQIAELQSIDHTGEAVQVRYMRNLPSTALIMTNPMSGNGLAIAEFYPYRASSADRPHILLEETDIAERKWFLFYRDQFLAMWRDARVLSEAGNGDANK